MARRKQTRKRTTRGAGGRPRARARRTRKATRAAKPRSKKTARRRTPVRRPRAAVDLRFKGLAFALEPPINNSPGDLNQTFRAKLDAALADLSAQGTPFKFVEGFRTVERQQWLFGSGRPSAQPFGRAGNIVTFRDGVTKMSNHQGTGIAGSGKAADCYPLKNGKVHIPPASDPVWRAYADAVKRQGLQAGLEFTSLKDAPHCELI